MENLGRESMLALIGSKPANQSVREFCKQNNLNEARYYYWRNRFNKETRAVAGNEFTQVSVKSSVQSTGVRLASLELPSGIVLSIYDTRIIPSLGQLTQQLGLR